MSLQDKLQALKNSTIASNPSSLDLLRQKSKVEEVSNFIGEVSLHDLPEIPSLNLDEIQLKTGILEPILPIVPNDTTQSDLVFTPNLPKIGGISNVIQDDFTANTPVFSPEEVVTTLNKDEEAYPELDTLDTSSPQSDNSVNNQKIETKRLEGANNLQAYLKKGGGFFRTKNRIDLANLEKTIHQSGKTN